MQVSAFTSHLLQTKIQAGTHQLLADEHIDKGGQNSGPTPHELLASSLAACTSITLRMYADRKQWPLGEIRVRVEIPEQGHATGTVINLVIELTGDLSDVQRKRLMEISGKCPIHKLLTDSILINTSMK